MLFCTGSSTELWIRFQILFHVSSGLDLHRLLITTHAVLPLEDNSPDILIVLPVEVGEAVTFNSVVVLSIVT